MCSTSYTHTKRVSKSTVPELGHSDLHATLMHQIESCKLHEENIYIDIFSFAIQNLCCWIRLLHSTERDLVANASLSRSTITKPRE